MPTSAARESTNTETYALTDGMTLLVKVDQGSAQTVTFNTTDFPLIGAATAARVAALITAALVGAKASATTSGTKVTITSDTPGIASYIEVTGGTANAIINFNTAEIQGTGVAVARVVDEGGMPSAPAFVDRVTVAFDTSYPTGGETLDLTDIIGANRTVLAAIPVDAQAGYVLQYDRSTDKLMVFIVPNAPNKVPLDEVDSATNLSTPLAALELLVFSV